MFLSLQFLCNDEGMKNAVDRAATSCNFQEQNYYNLMLHLTNKKLFGAFTMLLKISGVRGSCPVTPPRVAGLVVGLCVLGNLQIAYGCLNICCWTGLKIIDMCLN